MAHCTHGSRRIAGCTSGRKGPYASRGTRDKSHVHMVEGKEIERDDQAYCGRRSRDEEDQSLPSMAVAMEEMAAWTGADEACLREES